VGAGGGDNAGGIVVGAAAVGIGECIRIAVDRTHGRWGMSEIGGAGSSMVDVEGMRYMMKRRK